MDRADATALLCQYGYDTPLLSLAGRSLWARVVHVYDRDTLTLVAAMGGGEVCRSDAACTASTPANSRESNPDCAEHGRRARDRLVHLVSNGRHEQTSRNAPDRWHRTDERTVEPVERRQFFCVYVWQLWSMVYSTRGS